MTTTRHPITPGALPGVLRDAYVGRRTGLLTFTRDADRVSIRFVDGNIVYGEASATDLRLGESLVRSGRVARGDVDRAGDVVVREQRRLGEVLESFGLMDRNGVIDALATHAHELLHVVLGWPRGEYTFLEGDVRPRAHDLTLRLSTGQVILEAIRRIADPAALAFALGDLSRIVAVSTDPLLRFQQVDLTPTDAYLLSRIDGLLTAQAVIDMAPVPVVDAERSLLGLLCIGMVEYRERPAQEDQEPPVEALRAEILDLYRNRSTRTHFEVLQISRMATEDEARAAFVRLCRRYHPDVHHRAGMGDLRVEIEAVFHRLGVAYKVLGNAQERAEYEASLLVAGLGPDGGAEAPERAAPPAPLDAEARVRAGEAALRAAEESFAAGRYWDAIQQAQEALVHLRGLARRKARMLVAQCYLKNPHWRKQAEDELHTALREDPGDAEALFLLGTIYKEAGLRTRAEQMFRRTLDARPHHPGAQRELAAIEAASPRRPGLLKKLLD